MLAKEVGCAEEGECILISRRELASFRMSKVDHNGP